MRYLPPASFLIAALVSLFTHPTSALPQGFPNDAFPDLRSLAMSLPPAGPPLRTVSWVMDTMNSDAVPLSAWNPPGTAPIHSFLFFSGTPTNGPFRLELVENTALENGLLPFSDAYRLAIRGTVINSSRMFAGIRPLGDGGSRRSIFTFPTPVTATNQDLIATFTGTGIVFDAWQAAQDPHRLDLRFFESSSFVNTVLKHPRLFGVDFQVPVEIQPLVQAAQYWSRAAWHAAVRARRPVNMIILEREPNPWERVANLREVFALGVNAQGQEIGAPTLLFGSVFDFVQSYADEWAVVPARERQGAGIVALPIPVNGPLMYNRFIPPPGWKPAAETSESPFGLP